MIRPQHRILTILQCVIWLAAACALAFVFVKSLTPVYKEETISSAIISTTPVLQPGDVLTQPFSPAYDHLYGVEVALVYPDDISDDATVLVQILQDDMIIVNQPLTVSHCPDTAFLYLYTDVSDCLDDSFTIRIENISESANNTGFSLLAVTGEYLYPDSAGNYQINNLAEPAQLQCRFTYQVGYEYYKALTYVFWGVLAVMLFTSVFSRLFLRYSRHI